MRVRDEENLGDEILQKLVNLEVESDETIGSKVHQQVFQVITSLVETEWEKEALKLLKQQKNNINQFRLINYQVELGEKEQAISALLSLLQDHEPNIRLRASEALGKIGKAEPEVIAALLFRLQDEDSTVRLSAVESLVKAVESLEKIGKAESEIITALLSLLQNEDSIVIWKNAGALEKEALTLLKQQKSRIDQFRFISYQAELGEKEQAISALLSLLQDHEPNIRLRASEALGKIGKAEPEVIAALLFRLQDEDSTVRLSAVESLGKIAKDNPGVITDLSQVQDEDLQCVLEEQLRL